MLTRAGYALLASGLGLFLSGVGLGNYGLVLAGAAPVAILLVALADRPSAARATRTLSTTSPRRGDAVRVEIEVEVPAGRGFVEVHQALPASAALADGTNLRLLRLGRAPRKERIAFVFRAGKRGRHEIPPVALETVDPTGLLAPVVVRSGEPVALEVAPRVLGVRRVRAPGLVGRTLAADGARAKTGVTTTDFRELREYRPGDPPRAINWKATARRQTVEAHKPPWVNEYELEGRTAVWIFVDASTAMEVGTSLDNGLEHALEAASGVAAWYLDRGYRVGAYVYNAREAAPIYADTGNAQLRRISEALLATVPAAPAEGLDKAVARCRPHLVRDHPYVVVVTRVADPANALLSGLASIRRLTPTRRRRAPLLVVDVRPHRLQPLVVDADRDAAELADGLDRPAQGRVRRLGATLMRWDPASGPFTAVLLRGRSS